MVEELLDAGRVGPVPGDRLFVPDPSDDVFDSITRIAAFYRGSTPGRHTAEGATDRDE